MPVPTDPPPTPIRRAVIVLGMHRSGTSAVAGCLYRLGVDFGPRLMPATEDNVRGYFEHIDIVNLHDRLLLALGGSWNETRPFLPRDWSVEGRADAYRTELLALLQRDLPTAPLWGLKDPRLCRLLPWWEPVWVALDTRPLFVLVRRAPSEVAASLARREGFSAAKSHLLWLLHTLDAERATRAGDRVIVDFKDFLADWRAALEPVRAALGQSWPCPDAAPFVEPALIRSPPGEPDAVLPRWVAQADAAFRSGRETEMRAVFDGLTEKLDAAQEFHGASDAERSTDLLRQLETTRRQARWYEAEWHKARRRIEVVQGKLAAKAEDLQQLKNRVNNDINKSIMINRKISLLRILWRKVSGNSR